ncbi:MAG: phytanoyl-CoA dioxygenase family protein [Gammaproteobacteria bacterium]|nr:phytanoyl-CoA dioxygenase family protein [Gammaproteobacteria bacterium]
MTTKTINAIQYPRLNDEALSFYRKKGWVILTEIIKKEQLAQLSNQWQSLIQRHAKEIGCDLTDYTKVISQWRDLWKTLPEFNQIIKTPLSQLAATSFELSGARLLHDHIICKTAGAGNGIIPWHQDSMYWPVDRTGMSTWMSYIDVPVESGCLEVVSGSHLWEASAPVDFMSEKQALYEETPSVLLPVKAGSIILLHSRTWHRSQKTNSTQPRPAHIVLWVPPATRYWKENASWHPLNEQISVNKNQLLNENEFPIFGNKNHTTGSSFENKHQGVPKPSGMFNALDRAKQHIWKILNKQGQIKDLLKSAHSRATLSKKLMQSNPSLNPKKAQKIILNLWISGASFELHKARNVFNSAYQEWETLTKKTPTKKDS